MANLKIVVYRLKDLSSGLQDRNPLGKLKFSKSLFRNYLKGMHQINHEKSEYLGAKNLGYIYIALELKAA